MRRTFRNFIIAIALLVALFGTSIFLLVHLVEPDTFKQQISEVVQEKTGKTLNIEGGIDWSFFPWTGLRVYKISLVDPKHATNGAALLSVQEADVKINLRELFSAKIRISGIKLDQPVLNLVSDNQSKTWLEKLDANSSDLTSTQPAFKQDTHLIHLAPLLDIDVRDGQLSWTKTNGQKPYLFDKINIYASSINPKQPFTLNGKFQFVRPNTPAFDITGSSLIQLTDKTYSFKNTRINIDIPENKNQVFKVIITGNMRYTLADQQLDLNDLALNANASRVQGNLRWNMQQPVARIQGKLDILPANLNQSLAAFGINLNFDNPEALAKLSGKLHFDANQHMLEFDLHLDKSNLSGSFDLPTERNKPADLSLAIDRLNLSDYRLATPKQTQPEVKPVTDRPQPTKQEISAIKDWLALQHLKGKLAINSLQAGGIKLDNVTSNFSLMQGMVALSPLRADVYNGKLVSTLELNLQNTPKAKLNLDLQAIQIEPFIKDFLGRPSTFAGTASLKTRLSSSGETTEALRRGIDGNGKFNVQVRNVKGNDISAWLSQFTKRVTPISDNNPKHFHVATGRFKVYDSILRCDDLLVSSRHTQIKGRGSVDLYYQTLDYGLDVSNSTLKQKAISIPVSLSGPLDNPSVRIKIERIPEQIIKKGIKKLIKDPLQLLVR